jgi:hypothetical protein
MSITLNPSTIFDYTDQKTHPWRHCSVGRHFVKEYLRHNPPSKEHPNGSVSVVQAHCADNPTRTIKPKGIIYDLLSFDEISYIGDKYFADLAGPPTANILEFKDADKYDIYIRGWVHYWNEVLNFKEPLDPNLVKALIATESSFRLDPPENRTARGLMQVLPSTFGILRDQDGELINHLIDIKKSNYLDPSANICAGVRWLFRKKVLATHRLKREATWIEAVAEYKSYLAGILSGEKPDPKGMQDLHDYYSKLNKSN